MEDAWLHALKSDPSPQFADRLRRRLERDEAPASSRSWSQSQVAAMLVGVIGVALLLAVPSVRASAASLLAMFRVTNFVAVRVDPDRIQALRSQDLDLRTLIGENVQVLHDPGAPTTVASVEQAGAVAGLDVRLPRWLPDDTTIIETAVSGEHAVRVTANTPRLAQVLEALGIDDVQVPNALNGQTATIRVPPVVMVRYEHGGRRTRFLQARSPEVTLPADVDLAALGEIGLRILGLPAADAHHFASVIDWQTTLVVPIPPTATSIRYVDIAGTRGIAFEHQPPDQSRTNTVLWSTGDRVFGLVSIQAMDQVLAMANSVR